MAEVFVPTDAPNPHNYEVLSLLLDWEHARIDIWAKDPQGKRINLRYSGDTALTLMRQLNKLDLRTNSLQKRILERLSTDRHLPPGTVTGTPD